MACRFAHSPKYPDMTELETYYAAQLAKLETPDFVAWFEGWYWNFPKTKDRQAEIAALGDAYWNDRRMALLSWHAAKMPASESADPYKFVDSLRIEVS